MWDVVENRQYNTKITIDKVDQSENLIDMNISFDLDGSSVSSIFGSILRYEIELEVFGDISGEDLHIIFGYYTDDYMDEPNYWYEEFGQFKIYEYEFDEKAHTTKLKAETNLSTLDDEFSLQTIENAKTTNEILTKSLKEGENIILPKKDFPIKDISDKFYTRRLDLFQDIAKITGTYLEVSTKERNLIPNGWDSFSPHGFGDYIGKVSTDVFNDNYRNNLLLNTVSEIYSDKYVAADYTLDEKLAEGEKYTLSFEYKLDEDSEKTWFEVYNSAQTYLVTIGNIEKTGWGRAEVSFSGRENLNNTYIRIYHGAGGKKGGVIIKNAILVKGVESDLNYYPNQQDLDNNDKPVNAYEEGYIYVQQLNDSLARIRTKGGKTFQKLLVRKNYKKDINLSFWLRVLDYSMTIMTTKPRWKEQTFVRGTSSMVTHSIDAQTDDTINVIGVASYQNSLDFIASDPIITDHELETTYAFREIEKSSTTLPVFELEHGEVLEPIDTVDITWHYGDNVADGTGDSILQLDQVELIRDDKETFAPLMLDLYKGFTHQAMKFKSPSTPFIKGIVTLDSLDGEVEALVTKGKFSAKTWIGEYESEIIDQEENHTNYVGDYEKSVFETGIKVDKVAGKIELVSKEVKEQGEYVEAQLVLTNDKIEQEVKSREESVKALEDDIDNIETSIIENSAGIKNLADEVKIHAGKITTTEKVIKDLDGKVTQTQKDVTEQSSRLDVAYDKIEANVTETNKVKDRVSGTETQLNTHSSQLSQTAKDMTALSGTVDSQGKQLAAAEIKLDGVSGNVTINANNIKNKIDKGKAAQDINSGTVKINANRIVLNGHVTANGNVQFTTDGKIIAIGGSIGGWNISDTTLIGKNVGLDSSDTQERAIWAGGGWSESTPFRVYKDGRFFATNATISGKITATSGIIGGWEIGSKHLKSTAGDVTLAGGDSSAYAMWAGHISGDSAPFSVSKSGRVVATNATISGKITADSGTIAGWNISSSQLTTRLVALNGDANHEGAIWAGGGWSESTPFRVYKDGRLIARQVDIDGKITADSGTIAGWNISSSQLTSKNVALNGSDTHEGAMWAGGSWSYNTPFRVYKDGRFFATNATISGKITATSGSFTGSVYAGSGTIGSYTISGGSLVGNNVRLNTNSVVINGVSMYAATSNVIRVGGGMNFDSAVQVAKTLFANGGLQTYGTKNAIVPTRDGLRAIHAYETATAYFGDIGEVYVDKVSVVHIDEIFGDTIHLEDYHVFVSPYGNARVWVENRTPESFEIHTDSPCQVSWEIKGVRRGYRDKRLEVIDKTFQDYGKEVGDIEEGVTDRRLMVI